MKTAVIIPARLESRRLPQKLLLDATGQTLIEHTVQTAKKHFETIVATDSAEIFNIIHEKFTDVPCVITSESKSGTDRVRRAIQFLGRFSALPLYDVVVNWQADESEVDGQYVARAVREFHDHEADIITLAAPATPAEVLSPDVVKVVVDHQGMAMYFSRSPIPYNATQTLKHIGIYIFRYNILTALNTLDDTAYPSEKLEQIQWLESGIRIKVCMFPIKHAGINTIEEYQGFTQRALKYGKV